MALVPSDGRMALVLAAPSGKPLDRLLGWPLEVAPFLLQRSNTCAAPRNTERRVVHEGIFRIEVGSEERFGLQRTRTKERPFSLP